MALPSALANLFSNPEPTKASLEVEGDATYTLQFNPSDLSFGRGRRWIKGREFESGQPSLTFRGGEPDSLGFEVLLDQSEARATNALQRKLYAANALNPLFLPPPLAPENTRDVLSEPTGLFAKKTVADYVKAWFKMTSVMDVSGKGGSVDAYRRPPIVVFRWGSFVFSGAITKLDVSITLFDVDGEPRRATVKVDMVGRALADLKPEEVIYPDRPSASKAGGGVKDDGR
jgi:hypothetical protein